MFLCIRRIRRSILEASTRQKFAAFGITVILLWTFGFLEKFGEKSYDEFSWPAERNHKHFLSKFTQYPKCRFIGDGLKLMIIVKSAAKNDQMRDSVRKTWGKYQVVDGVEVMPVHVVGRHENLELMRKVEREAEEFDDILSISALDTYRNNTFKLFAAIDYGSYPHGCAPPDYVFLVDDDYMVHIPNLVKFAKTKRSTDLVYEGFVFDTSPFRMKIHKHYISLAEYPFSRYPPYVSAGAVFLNSLTARKLQEGMRSLKMFPFDDVFTGIMAKTVGVPATHNENFVFWSRRIGVEEWRNGLVAAHGYARKDLETEYNKIFN